MKLNRLATVLTLGLALTSLVATGCKKKPGHITDIPASRTGTTGRGGAGPQGPGPGQPIDTREGTGGTAITDLDPTKEGVPLNPHGNREGWIENPSALAAETIHFAFDSATVRSGDQSKLENVAAYLKSHPVDAVRVEGNCDQRGTEEYNRSLGERRALAAREELVRLGIAPDRIDTISYGEDRPADPADNEAAYAKNRRDDFILLSPPAK